MAAEIESPRYFSGRASYRSITEEVATITLDFQHPWRWLIALAVTGLFVLLFLVALGWLFWWGVGVWGNNSPVYWGLAITNYVWWIGMAHAGTLISALLLLMNRGWRNALNRFAEAMTVFAVLMAGLQPIIHLGRPWFFYWLFPYSNTMNIWPQYRSPLLWDVFAVGTYLIVSVLYWYIGLIPDLANVRDRARSSIAQRIYGILALGWRGSARHWQRWRMCYYLLAGMAVPLVPSIYWTVAMLFSGSVLPGWHHSLFPPYFVIGAIFEGFAVVTLIAVLLRTIFHLDHLITPRHFDLLGQMLLLTGMITFYCYIFEAFTAWYSGDPYERATLADRWFGVYAWSYWGAVVLNFVVLQALWFSALRRRVWLLAAVGAAVTVGMWLERFMLVVTAPFKDFLPSSYHIYVPSLWEWAHTFGGIGTFLFMFLLFVRFLPMMSMFELKELLHDERREARS